MIKYATKEQAQEIVAHWGGQKSSVRHIGNSASSVFEYKKGKSQEILRLTDAAFRTYSEIEGELEYLNYLKKLSISCCYPVVSDDGKLLVSRKWENTEFICSSLSFATGIYIDESSPYWKMDFFREWRRNLASIHSASKSYNSPNQKLWEWDQEILFKKADVLLPKDDLISRNELNELFKILSHLPKTNNNYGIIHADHAPPNFRYNPTSCKITAFDFGNSCYHWYLADLANSLSTIQLKKDRDLIKNGILEGYSETEILPKDYEEQIGFFLRLRVLYVYLDRLYSFGQNPNTEQKKTLDILKNRVHSNQNGSR